jgi:hypothetical protein
MGKKELPASYHIKGENRESSKLGKGQHSAVDVGGSGGREWEE